MTKRALFTPIYLDGWDAVGNNRYYRVVRWLNYMLQADLRDALDYDDIVVSDNGSSQQLKDKLRAEFPELIWIEHETSLKKTGDKHHDYPYCWRALYDYAKVAASGSYEKIYRIENDHFILTERLARYLATRYSGWVAMGLKRPRAFPEDGLSVICEGSYHLLTDFCSGDYMQHHGKVFERTLPFTHVENGFNCGRFGTDKGPPQQTALMDSYGQAPFSIELTYRRVDHGFNID